MFAAAARSFFTRVLDGLGAQLDARTADTFAPDTLQAMVVGRPVARSRTGPEVTRMDQDARRERLSSAAMLLEHTVLSSGLSSGAATPTEVRRAAFDAAPAEGALAAYVTGVEIHPELVTAAMVEDLRQTGMSQDALFDVTVAAALGAARRRLQAGMELIARPEP